MLKFAVFLMTAPMWADVMTIYDTGNYFVGKASAQTAVSNSFNFDLAGLSGYRISGALLEARAGYGSQNYVLDPTTNKFAPGPPFDFELTGTGWTQHFIGGGSGNDPFWVGFVFGADAVTGLNSTIGAELQLTGRLVNIPANAVEYFMLDGSFESRLVLQVEAVPEPRGWILLVSVLAPILLSPVGARLCRKPRLYH